MSDIPQTSYSGSSSVIHSSDGPPLILVFLASGLFVGAVLSVLALRRIYPTINFTSRRLHAPEPAQEKERPKLWDVYIDPDSLPPPDGEKGGGGGWSVDKWADILPLAVRYLPPPSWPPAPPPVVLPPQPSRPRFSYFQRADRPHSAAPASIAVAMTENPHTPSPPGKLQIAVTIAMPSRERSCFTKEKAGPSMSPFPGETVEYCIGLTELPAVSAPEELEAAAAQD
ncbi:hypothetical protein WOLCODRAFT_155785 [Wolfiporia cocos MD-104 SS10]|uniref:Uncharacterized protein n=1 Tax=Wolfiporia cocos (strain MD-104) TaxID=742152 RepID=A0A2H3JEI9_WOLCO|nr:hypothetical protein WOLCODRAFT_155785 [Wolfiporia cocos MD-104 SS10]